MNNGQPADRSDVKVKKFMIWLVITASFMLFAALISAFLVSVLQSVKRSIGIPLPNTFAMSTLVIIFSSYTLHLANKFSLGLNFSYQKRYLVITLILGLVFFLLQLLACKQLVYNHTSFNIINNSSTYIYLLTGAHLLHILAGIFLISYAFIGRVTNKPYVSVNLRMEAATLFWHFLDGLWLIIYLFMLVYK